MKYVLLYMDHVDYTYSCKIKVTKIKNSHLQHNLVQVPFIQKLVQKNMCTVFTQRENLTDINLRTKKYTKFTCFNIIIMLYFWIYLRRNVIESLRRKKKNTHLKNSIVNLRCYDKGRNSLKASRSQYMKIAGRKEYPQ